MAELHQTSVRSRPQAWDLSIRREAIPAPEGTHRVLATLIVGEESYRVFADLIVTAGNAHLRLHCFDTTNGDERGVERKINISLTQPEVVPLEPRLSGAGFVLSAGVRLDDAKAAAIFGRGRLPAT